MFEYRKLIKERKTRLNKMRSKDEEYKKGGDSPSPTLQRDKNVRINRWLIKGVILTFILILLDVGTTIYGFSHGFKEANPIVVAMMNNWGMLGFYMSFVFVVIGLALAFLIAYKVRYRWYKISWASLLWLGVFGRTMVVAHNINIMFFM